MHIEHYLATIKHRHPIGHIKLLNAAQSDHGMGIDRHFDFVNMVKCIVLVSPVYYCHKYEEVKFLVLWCVDVSKGSAECSCVLQL